MNMKKMIREEKEATITAVKTLKEYPLPSLGHLFPIGIVCVSCIGFIVGMIKFIVTGGYEEQISSMQDDLFVGISQGFTGGTASVLTSGPVAAIITLLLLAEFIVLAISYFKTEAKPKIIIGGILLGIGGSFTMVTGFIFAVNSRLIPISEEGLMRIVSILYVFSGGAYSAAEGIKTLIFISAAGIIGFFVLTLLSYHRWMVKRSAIALLIAYILLPLLLLLAENVIPMAIGLVAIVVIGIILLIVGGIFLLGGGSGTAEYDDTRQVTQIKTAPKKENHQKVNNQKVIDQWSGPFWRDKGGLGLLQAQEDYIYCNDVWNTPKEVCSISEFEKGTKAIIDKKTGRRVMEIAGCKTPEK